MFGFLRDKMGKAILRGFEELTPDIHGIYASAHSYVLSDWQLLQSSMVTGSGAASMAIPGLHLFGLAADVAFLMNRMSVCCYGMGAILGYDAGLGNILEREDFAVVLARWSGDDSLSNASVAKTAAGLAGHLGGKGVGKILASAAAANAGLLVGKKLGVKGGTKVVGKFATKLGTKAAGGFAPFAGPAIGGGVNLYFITSITNEAAEWYRLKISVERGGEAGASSAA